MGKLTNKVSSNTRGLAAMMKKLQMIDGASTVAGYDETPHPTADMSYAELAAIHEYGAPRANIPARPFMTEAAYHDQDNITIADTSKLVQNYLYNKGNHSSGTFRQSLTLMARQQAENITYSFDTGNFVITKNPTPLMDTWELRENPKYWVMTGKDNI